MGYKIKYGGSSTYAGYHTPHLYTSNQVYETAYIDNDLKVYSPGLAPASRMAHQYTKFELGDNAIIHTIETFIDDDGRITDTQRTVYLGDFLYNQQEELSGGSVNAVAFIVSYPSKSDWQTDPSGNEWRDGASSILRYNGNLNINQTPFYGKYYDDFWGNMYSNSEIQDTISDDFKQYFPAKWQENALAQDLIASPGDIEQESPTSEETAATQEEQLSMEETASTEEAATTQEPPIHPEDTSESDNSKITIPKKFNKKSADKITNFNPSIDTLEIDAESFDVDNSATFAAGRNKKAVKKKLAKQDFDFLYDEKKGGLYFNENGADQGFGEGGIIAILKGAPDLTSDNLEFI